MLYVLLSILMSLASVNSDSSQTKNQFDKSEIQTNHSTIYLTIEEEVGAI